jgi:hypothetical protein
MSSEKEMENLKFGVFSFTDRFNPIGNIKMQSLKQLLEPVSSKSYNDSSSSSMERRQNIPKKTRSLLRFNDPVPLVFHLALGGG